MSQIATMSEPASLPNLQHHSEEPIIDLTSADGPGKLLAQRLGLAPRNEENASAIYLFVHLIAELPLRQRRKCNLGNQPKPRNFGKK